MYRKKDKGSRVVETRNKYKGQLLLPLCRQRQHLPENVPEKDVENAGKRIRTRKSQVFLLFLDTKLLCNLQFFHKKRALLGEESNSNRSSNYGILS